MFDFQFLPACIKFGASRIAVLTHWRPTCGFGIEGPTNFVVPIHYQSTRKSSRDYYDDFNLLAAESRQHRGTGAVIGIAGDTEVALAIVSQLQNCIDM